MDVQLRRLRVVRESSGFESSKHLAEGGGFEPAEAYHVPQGTDLSGYHPDSLEFVTAQLNNRPRKTLGWVLQPNSPTGYSQSRQIPAGCCLAA